MILDGKKIAADIRREVAAEAASLRDKGIVPTLVVYLVGDDPASAVYVRNKEKACKEVGIECRVVRNPSQIDYETFSRGIYTASEDRNVDGVMVQLPLPPHLDIDDARFHITPLKDVDGITSYCVDRLAHGNKGITPCTPAGIMELLKRYDIPVVGKRCVVVGRSDIVGKPMAMMLLNANATVTVCHSRTENLAAVCREADILIAAVGKPKLITADMVKPGAVVIDVGINRTEDGKLVGDVDFDAVEPIASYITPVPGGVGPMTVAMLLKNVVTLAKHSWW